MVVLLKPCNKSDVVPLCLVVRRIYCFIIFKLFFLTLEFIPDGINEMHKKSFSELCIM